MNKCATKVHVQFLVTDFECEPEELLQELGLTADESWREGSVRFGNAKHRHKNNGFKLLDKQFEATWEHRGFSSAS